MAVESTPRAVISWSYKAQSSYMAIDYKNESDGDQWDEYEVNFALYLPRFMNNSSLKQGHSQNIFYLSLKMVLIQSQM